MTRTAVRSSPTNGHSRFPSRKRCRQFLFAYPSVFQFALFQFLIRSDAFYPLYIRRTSVGPYSATRVTSQNSVGVENICERTADIFNATTESYFPRRQRVVAERKDWLGLKLRAGDFDRRWDIAECTRVALRNRKE